MLPLYNYITVNKCFRASKNASQSLETRGEEEKLLGQILELIYIPGYIKWLRSEGSQAN